MIRPSYFLRATHAIIKLDLEFYYDGGASFAEEVPFLF